jgi:hypothetical protein
MSESTFMGVPREKIDWSPRIDFNKCNYCMECVDRMSSITQSFSTSSPASLKACLNIFFCMLGAQAPMITFLCRF